MYRVSVRIITDVYTNSGHRQCNGNKITTFVAPLSDKALITQQSM